MNTYHSNRKRYRCTAREAQSAVVDAGMDVVIHIVLPRRRCPKDVAFGKRCRSLDFHQDRTVGFVVVFAFVVDFDIVR